MTRIDRSEIGALRQLTEAAFEADHARLAAARRAEGALRAQIEALRAAGSGRLGLDDPARRVGADLVWQSWVEDRRRALAVELAQALARVEAAQAEVARSFGRDCAVRMIAERVGRIDARTRTRREEREVGGG